MAQTAFGLRKMVTDKHLLALYERTRAGRFSPTQQQMFEYIKSSGSEGLTKHELLEKTGLSAHSVHKRLQVLRICGWLVKVPQKSGYPKWKLTQFGEKFTNKTSVFSGVRSVFDLGVR